MVQTAGFTTSQLMEMTKEQFDSMVQVFQGYKRGSSGPDNAGNNGFEGDDLIFLSSHASRAL